MEVKIRNTEFDDIDQVKELQRKVYPGTLPWSTKQLINHMKIFPEGQFVAEFEGKIVGTSSSLIILWDDYGPEHNWKQMTDTGTFNNHDKNGKTLYGAEVCVDPDLRGTGIAIKLYKARKDLCKSLNLKRIISAGRLPNYHLYADKISPELYAMKVLWGDIYDPVLRFQTRQGFQFCGIIENYLQGDKESLEYASLIVWINYDYKENKKRTSNAKSKNSDNSVQSQKDFRLGRV